MKKQLLFTAGAVTFAFAASTASAATGEALFKHHCAVCHPDGGNIIKPQQTLHKKDLEKAGVKNWKGIVKTMRNPEPGMTKFDTKTISGKDAQAIAEYVFKTFK